jgi:DNA polymerase III alpha subunit (gram-positive type)
MTSIEKTIILDFETSGLNPYHEDIIEIGAKVLGEDKSFQCLVRPKSGKLISQKITDITGITNRTIRAEGKLWKNAYIEFYNWLIENLNENGKNAIVSHNGTTFDFIFLKRLLHDLHEVSENIDKFKEIEIYYIDTLLLSRKIFNNRTYYNQGSLCKTFNIEIIDAHRALGDVLCLEMLYLRLCQKGNLNNIDEVYKYLNFI